MAKRIIKTLGWALLFMLVLVLVASMLIEHGGIFGDAIQWLLVALVGILMLVTLYFAVSSMLDIFRKRDSDEELMDEASIEEILASESVRQKQTARMVAINLEKEKAPAKAKQAAKPQRPARNPLRTPRKKPAEAPVEVRRQATEVDEQLAEREARRRREMVEQQRVQNEAKADMIARAQEDARARAKQAEQEKQEKDPRKQLAEAEQQLRGSDSAQHRLALQEEKTRVISGLAAGNTNTDAEDADEAERRKAAAIESARKQAEAAAAARRRAAQRAAQTQGFAPIVPGAMPGTGKVGETAVWPAATAKPAAAPQPEAPAEDNIWNRMNVRQSARPVLSTELFAEQDKTVVVPDASGEQTRRQATGAIPSTAGAKAGAAPEAVDADGKPEKKWAPAKLPGAWQASGKTSIPGDMNYNSKLVTAPGRAPKTGQPVVPPPEKPKPVAKTEPVVVQETEIAVVEAVEIAGLPTKKGSTRSEQAERLASRTPIPKTTGAGQPVKAAEAAPPATEAKPAEREPLAAATGNIAVGGEIPSPAIKPTEAVGGEEKRPRGRPPKPKTEEELNAPKRPRGRPPKPKTEEELSAPKRPRGRPPKPKTEEELSAPKRPRGRPPKPKTEEELNAPKRPRGRPPKPKTEEELSAPKRPRGRPPKPKTEEELNAPKRPRGRPPKAPSEGTSPQ